MKHTVIATSLACLLALAGCAQDGEPVGAGVGDSEISGGAGGEGSGPTGTGGGVPGENPAGDEIHSGGTGTDAPSP